jgi:phenylpropionate dioxygenase-like ring-hydroxylating dioxygenase large terminal subunit
MVTTSVGKADGPESAAEDQGASPGEGAGLHDLLVPPRPKPRASVVRLAKHWFVVALSTELEKKPIARTVMGVPLVLFRDGSGRPGALLDRCPHRNVPLSLGKVQGGQLECAYHGWRFDRCGECRHVPSLVGEPGGAARRAPSYACEEQDGFIWVVPTAGFTPKAGPYRLTHAEAPGYTTVRRVVDAESTMHAAIENALDVPHTAFLHKGLFRTKSRGIDLEVVVTRSSDRVVAEYIGEPRPPGIAGRLLSPSGGVVVHFDRFILPSIAEVEYKIGTEIHTLVTTAVTPVSDFFTKLFAVVSFRARIPGWVVKPFLEPLAMRIFGQDAEILRAQTDNIRRFGGEQFASTEIDVLGRHIWRLLKAAERSEAGETETSGVVHEERVTLRV